VKKRYANIIFRTGELPHLMIVTDGNYTTQIPCSNSSIKTLKRTARELYGVRVFFISEILPDADDGQYDNPDIAGY